MRHADAGMRGEIEKKLKTSKITDLDYVRNENFWLAALAICDAGILLGERYAELAF